MVLPPEPAILSVEQLLIAAATIRGFMAIGGRPDQSRAARIILKDFVSVGWIQKTKGCLESNLITSQIRISNLAFLYFKNPFL